jgi:molybdenum cofactor synthesis domain-containing protein
MNLPGIYKVLVITLSDRAFRGEYEDLSGPLVMRRMDEFMKSEGWEHSIGLKLIPDDPEKLDQLIRKSSDDFDIIFTTGGTGIGPRDITVDTVKPLLSKEMPGIMEYIRVKYGVEKPNALLSRGIAGITGKSLIYTLPGSVKAVDEYMTEILRTVKHTLLMFHGIDSHQNNQ